MDDWYGKISRQGSFSSNYVQKIAHYYLMKKTKMHMIYVVALYLGLKIKLYLYSLLLCNIIVLQCNNTPQTKDHQNSLSKDRNILKLYDTILLKMFSLLPSNLQGEVWFDKTKTRKKYCRFSKSNWRIFFIDYRLNEYYVELYL